MRRIVVIINHKLGDSKMIIKFTITHQINAKNELKVIAYGDTNGGPELYDIEQYWNDEPEETAFESIFKAMVENMDDFNYSEEYLWGTGGKKILRHGGSGFSEAQGWVPAGNLRSIFNNL